MVEKENELWEWIKIFVIAAILTAIIRFFLFTPIVVDGESMMPTLEDNDRMIVNKLSYIIGEPERFDIIVLHAPEDKDYIKRIIGLPGDHIEYKNDTLYINGEKYDEPYLDEYKQKLVGGTLTEPFSVDVPEGHVFVMGDNRRYSKDSRHIGPIPLEDILGKANIIYWPLDEFKIIN
ncbi:signal peptidase I [Fervidibacillus albus]|uniref:Signal peptidase I n=1 Tax=Fervidibacillus albus TaxID=2980026 RepID=A0A9E8RVI3_9BACI|nr:signal peptidase I [Fervidibacillus albus]WAA10695.1 signal peptidase I [Fervidibacillus albus]